MAEFLFLYHGGAPQAENLSPKDMQRHMDKWDAWVRDLTERGVFEIGQALEQRGKTVNPGGVIKDGPFPETKELIGGFSLIRARDLEEATAIAESCPIFEYHGRVEVRPIVGRCMEPADAEDG